MNLKELEKLGAKKGISKITIQHSFANCQRCTKEPL